MINHTGFLTDKDIRGQCDPSQYVQLIENYDEKCQLAISYKLRLADYYREDIYRSPLPVNVGKKNWCYEERLGEKENVRLAPGESILATTVEKINLGYYDAAYIMGENSLMRTCIVVQPRLLSPGFKGFPMLLITNMGSTHAGLEIGNCIAQIVFYRLSVRPGELDW